MKAIDFLNTEKHLNYFNSVKNMDKCFGIDLLNPFYEHFDLSEGKGKYLERVQRIQDNTESLAKAKEIAKSKMLKHKEVAKFLNFSAFGYTMGGQVLAFCEIEIAGNKFKCYENINDTREWYSGRKKYTPTHGEVKIEFTMKNGVLRYKDTLKKIK